MTSSARANNSNADQQRCNLRFDKGSKRRVDILIVAGLKNLDF